MLKFIRKSYILVLCCFLLISCEPNIGEPIRYEIADGRGVILINGSQENWAEPWLVSVKFYFDETLTHEELGVLWLSDFSEEHIKIEWVNSKRCKIVFYERDGETGEVLLPLLP